MMRSTRQRSRAQEQMESPMSMGHANTEVQISEEEPQESAGENAMVVAVNGAAAAVEITVRIAKARLHCPVCTLPLKPPIFHCAFGHLACGVCHLTSSGRAGAARCFVCGDGGGYARSSAMEDIVRSAKVLCPHDAYGCGTYVAYYDAAEHQLACPHAPCLCSEPGCGFAGTPAALRDHLAGAHAWPVDGIRYGVALRLRVPELDPAQHRRLLSAGGDEDGAVFFLAVGALSAPAPPLRVVSLVCARPEAAAAEGPWYACTIRAVVAADADAAAGKEGRKEESVVLEKKPVPSSSSPGETSMDVAASLLMLRRSVPGAAPAEMDITVRIDKIM